MADYALSVKQPWAALLVHGLKTIEVRSWPTARRGRILIHAARLSDPSPDIWRRVPDALSEAARQVGGVIGCGDLADCTTYLDRATFAVDQKHHLNNPDWFRPPRLYGFVMANPQALPFRPYPGWVRFFPVKDEVPLRTRRKARPAGPDLFSQLGLSE